MIFVILVIISLFIPIIPVSAYSKIMVIGGDPDRKSVELYYPNNLTKNYLMKQQLPNGRITHSAGVLCGKVIVAGGVDYQGVPYKKTLIYKSNIWIESPTTVYTHYAGAGVVADNKFFICGGIAKGVAGNPGHAFCEYLSDNATKWVKIPQMNVRRSMHAAAAIDGQVYMMGGSSRFSSLNSVEKFDIETNHWSMVAPMINGRLYFGAVAVGNFIYVCSSLDGGPTVARKTCEKYDQKMNRWQYIAPIPRGRDGFPMVVFEKKIYSMGENFEIYPYEKQVFIYDIKNNNWSIGADLIKGRAESAAVVL